MRKVAGGEGLWVVEKTAWWDVNTQGWPEVSGVGP